MPFCKFCGNAVTSSPVWHSECWEKKVDEIATKFCDGFCHWFYVCQSEDESQMEHCDKDCPFIEFLNLGL